MVGSYARVLSTQPPFANMFPINFSLLGYETRQLFKLFTRTYLSNYQILLRPVAKTIISNYSWHLIYLFIYFVGEKFYRIFDPVMALVKFIRLESIFL